MTKEDFQLLTPHQQEDVINSGEQISRGSDEGVVHPLVIEPEKVQVESGVPSSPQSTRVVSSSTQPAHTFSIPSEENPAQVYGFLNPVEMLYLLDDEIASGTVKLHNWQVQIMLDFAEGVLGGKDQNNPFQAVVRACNGSGKDKYVIAPCAVWMNMCTTLWASCVVTSSSGVQLDNQTCTYIEQLCLAANAKIHPKVWKINYRYFECLDTRSPIMCFATDEPGKAEGYHPLKSNAKFALFESEAKTVPDTIYNAQNKCTGYTHRVIVSTPGLPMGHFFDLDSTSISRKDLEKNLVKKTEIDWIGYHITAFDCSHISRNYIEQMKRDLPGGELGAAYKSQVLAEFGTTDEMVVIPFIYVKRATKTQTPWIKEAHNKAGLDLSDGGAETVLLVRNGNKHLKTIPFKFDNTEDTITFLEEKFYENDLVHAEAYIYADCCGIGKPMLNALRRKGWKNIRYVDSRSKSREPKVYTNQGTELFFNVRRLLERNELIVIDEPLLIRQLSTRYYKMLASNLHALLTKLEQRSRGYPSPDRADAFNLAFWDYKSTYVLTTSERASGIEAAYKEKLETKVKGSFTLKNWATGSDSPTRRLGKRPDTTYLMEQIEQHNKRLQLINLVN